MDDELWSGLWARGGVESGLYKRLNHFVCVGWAFVTSLVLNCRHLVAVCYLG